ncbi:MAG: VOC family protein [Ilumatobacteraceae bacterium]
MIRLRQVAFVARDLDAAVAELCEPLGLSVCFHDPGVAAFGLHNSLMVIGDQFLEVVAPTRDDTTAGRLLDKRDGDGGYMAIYEVDDLDQRERGLDEAGIRIVWRGDFDDIRGRHLHPADVGAAIVSLDQPQPNGAWRWGGPQWVAHRDNSVVTAIAGVVVGAHDPHAMRRRWQRAGVDHAVRFQPAGPRGDGIDELELVATDRERAGETYQACGVTLRLV